MKTRTSLHNITGGVLKAICTISMTMASSCVTPDMTDDHILKELEVTAEIEQDSKAPVTSTAFSSGAEIGLCLTDGSGKYDGMDYRNIKYTMNSQSQWNAASSVYLSGTAGTLYGYHPYSSSVTDISAIPVSVASQTDHMYSDPLTGLSNRNRTASLTMKHALSVIKVRTVRGDYSGKGAVTQVTLRSPALAATATLDATDGTLSGFEGTDNAYTSAENYTINSTATVRDYLVIPTGSLAALTLEIVIDGIRKSITSGKVTFTKGMVYQYTLTIGADVTDELLITDPSVVQRGDIALANGRFIARADIPRMTDSHKAQAAGVVFWTENEPDTLTMSTDMILTQDFPSYNHGLIASLKDMGTMKYQESPHSVIIYQKNISQFKPESSSYKGVGASYKGTDYFDRELIHCLLGYQNTKILEAYNKFYKTMAPQYTILPVDGLEDYRSICPDIQNTTGWYVPSAREMNLILGEEVNNEERMLMNDILEYMPYADLFEDNMWYWTSTQSYDSDSDLTTQRADTLAVSMLACAVRNIGDLGYINYENKQQELKVRPVCAF